jgi:hypothetical protein
MEPETGARADERVRADEAQDERRRFFADQVAAAFDVSVDRVERAMAGEFGLTAGDVVDAKQAQHLAEVLLGDVPRDEI